MVYIEEEEGGLDILEKWIMKIVGLKYRVIVEDQHKEEGSPWKTWEVVRGDIQVKGIQRGIE